MVKREHIVKKRILSLVLCLCMLSSLALLFTSCGKKKVDFSAGYDVVFARNVSESMTEQVSSFAELLNQKTGKEAQLKKVKAGTTLSGETKYEILIGDTNRPETEKALSKIKDHGYIITVIGKKIVIAGTTTFLTSLALDSFTETLRAAEGTISTLAVETVEVHQLEMLELTDKWAFVYSSCFDGLDYVNAQIKDAKGLIDSFSDVSGTEMQMIDDSQTAEKEILVGIVNREEAKSFLSGMDANNYGIGSRNGKLFISGLNDGMIRKAFVAFLDALRDSICEVKGDKRIYLPKDFTRICTDSESAIVVDFPRPEGLKLSGTIDVYDGSMEYYYEGEGVNADAYAKYGQSLEAAGYTVYTESTAENSIFRIYVNREKNTTLYVAYNDFKHVAAQSTDHQKAIRIVASSLGSVNLLEEDMFAPDFTYGAANGTNKVQNSAITSVKLTYVEPNGEASGGGNLYIVTLEDGSFIVLDGGTERTQDRDRIYSILKELYVRGHDGQAPTANNPIRIAAWILSHGHSDHFGSMATFLRKFCADYNTYYVTVDRLIANFASDEEYYNSEKNPTSFNTTVRDNLAEFSALISDAPGEEVGFKYYKVHTGQRFWLANIEFEVLYTHEDFYPLPMHTYNNTSTVIRMSMYHTNGGVVSEGSKTTMLWTGDVQTEASKWMRATYGSYLKSDMVQIAHHGGVGCEWEFYQLAAPVCVWWPTSLAKYRDYQQATGNGFRRVNFRISYELTSLKYIIVADICNYTVTITANGPDFSIGGDTGIFGAAKGIGETIEYTTVSDRLSQNGLLKTNYCTD